MDVWEKRVLGSGTGTIGFFIYLFLAALGLGCPTGFLWLRRVCARVCGRHSWGTRTWSLGGTWDLVPRAGIEPVSPALAGGFLTMGPPGKARTVSLMNK